MAVERDNPYGTFNYLVDLGTGDTASIKAGFQEVSGLNIEVTSADYRNGNDKVNHVRKINGIYKVGDITLKRGLIGAPWTCTSGSTQVRTATRQRGQHHHQLRDESGRHRHGDDLAADERAPHPL